jgi:hypothetical protein
MANSRVSIYWVLTASALLALSACGGGGTAATSAATTTLSGSVVKGPVTGATVTIKKASDGTVLATTTTGAGGAYSVSLDYVGDVIVEVTGGNYIDEASNVSTPLAAPLKVVLAVKPGNVTGVVTPLTTMAFSNAFPSAATPVTAAAFDARAASLAADFKLAGVNLATTVPSVSGTMNDYGKVLAGISRYMQLNNVTLPALVNSSFTSAQWGSFSGSFATAYNAANPGSSMSYSFSGNTATIGGSGVGGGSGTCGVNIAGSMTVAGISVPLNLDYCITGIAAGSCGAGNSTLAQALSGQSGIVGAVNLAYRYSDTCVANPVVTLKLN